MNDDANNSVKPGLTPAAEAALRARREREAAALRDNLRRRKAQTRERSPAPPDPAKAAETDPWR